MFQLFKKRNFSELVGDTFTFFKMHGKHYFRNYFIINGGFLLILLILVYFILKVFFEGLFANLNGGFGGTNNNFEHYLSNNLELAITLGILTALTAIFLSILSYAYPVAYMKLLETKTNFSTNEIIAVIKSKIGKIVIFFIASLFILIPIMLITVVLCFVLIFLLIGIPLLFIVIPALMCWFSLSFYDYISTDKGYFEALGNGFSLLKQKFWPVVGSTAVMHLIMQIVVGFVSMIPYLIGVFSMFTSFENQAYQPEQLSFLMIMLGVTMVLSLLLNFIFQNFILVNQGIIYYSLREENENNTPKSEIDLIGTYSE